MRRFAILSVMAIAVVALYAIVVGCGQEATKDSKTAFVESCETSCEDFSDDQKTCYEDADSCDEQAACDSSGDDDDDDNNDDSTSTTAYQSDAGADADSDTDTDTDADADDDDDNNDDDNDDDESGRCTSICEKMWKCEVGSGNDDDDDDNDDNDNDNNDNDDNDNNDTLSSEQCMEQNCAKELTACEENADCAAFITCIEDCSPNEPDCLATCKSDYPAGDSLTTALTICKVRNEC